MAKAISLSFKENEQDLYDYLTGKRSPSNYIKELIENDMKGRVVVQHTSVIEPAVKEAPATNKLSALVGIGK